MSENSGNKKFRTTMSFLDHLESLRWHIVRAVIALIIATIAVFVYIKEVVQYIILGPLNKNFITHKLACELNKEFCFDSLEVTYQATGPSEQFTKAILIAAVGGLILSFPYIIWELWRFIKPGLYIKEIKKTRGVVLYVSGLFFMGVLFAYFVVLPFTFRFFASFTLADNIQNLWRIGEVMTLVVQFCLAGGVLFEMPVLAYVLSLIGILTPQFMIKYRKHAFIISLVVAGILTPSPDIISQLLLAVPMLILYEMSIWISQRVYKNKLKEAQNEA